MLHSTNDFNEDFGIKDDDESISDHLDQNQNDAATAESEFRRVTKLFYHIFHRKLFNFIVILHIKTKTFIKTKVIQTLSHCLNR